MADNVNIPTTGSGDTGPVPVAADDIGGVKYQRVKISIGADGFATDLSAAAALPVALGHSSTTAQTSVACSASSQVLLSANVNAKQRTIVNDSTSAGYLRFDASAATTTNWSYKLQAGQTYEFNPVLYDGEVRAISDTATGSWRITEWT